MAEGTMEGYRLALRHMSKRGYLLDSASVDRLAALAN